MSGRAGYLFLPVGVQISKLVLQGAGSAGLTAHADAIIQSLGGKGQVATLPGNYYAAPFLVGNDMVLISGVLYR